MENNENNNSFLYSIPTDDPVWEIAFSLNENFILWSVEYNLSMKIYYAKLNLNSDQNYNESMVKPIVLLEKKVRPYIQFDWIHSLLYLKSYYNIEVLNINEKDKIFLLIERSNQILNSVINPEKLLIFWTERTSLDKRDTNLFGANQDGSQIELLKYHKSVLIHWLTIDYKNNVLILCDERFTLFTIGFDGNDFKQIVKFPNKKLLNIPGTYDYIFESYFFAHQLDENFTNILKYDFNTNEEKEILQISNSKSKFKYQLSKFRIIHKSRQPDSINRCSNASCSQLCLPINYTNYRCVCNKNQDNLCVEYVSKFYLFICN